MKIVCPACEATYQVPEAVLEQRRAVRCARCGNDWIPGDQPRVADAAAPAAAPPQATAPQPGTGAQTSGGFAAGAETVAAPAAFAAEPEPPVPPVAPLSAPLSAPPSARVTETAAEEDTAALPEATHTPAAVAAPAAEPAPAAPRLTQSAASAIAGDPAGEAAPRETPIAAWIGSVAVLLMLVLAGIAFRGPIMKAWPPSERLYAALGLK